tara:strand:+ start:2250 stop:2405 length:156 start_codon:yes stop_codon:yes gene_type:complete
MKKYKIQDKETGTIIEDNLTENEAKKLLIVYEIEDNKNEIYEKDFYEIVEM